MISVTVAANGRSRRYVGAHLKAYGSGRLSIAELDYDPSIPIKNKQRFWSKVLWKVIDIMVSFLRMCFPFLGQHSKQRKLYRRLTKGNSINSPPSPVQTFNDDILVNIFKHLDGRTVQNCAHTCRRWRKAVLNNMDTLPKISLDQIRILFDEGEIILYPRDEKRTPERHTIPPLRQMEERLRHFNADSILVRGLIPVETIPVLKALNSMHFTPRQIYFIWCRFSPDSISLLHQLLFNNRDTLADLGLEDCSPTQLLSDDLISVVVPGLISLRVWNDGRSGMHAITDNTIRLFIKSISSGTAVESIDLSSCALSLPALSEMIVAWVRHPKTDLSLSISCNPQLNKEMLLEMLGNDGIQLQNGYICSGAFRMTLYC